MCWGDENAAPRHYGFVEVQPKGMPAWDPTTYKGGLSPELRSWLDQQVAANQWIRDPDDNSGTSDNDPRGPVRSDGIAVGLPGGFSIEGNLGGYAMRGTGLDQLLGSGGGHNKGYAQFDNEGKLARDFVYNDESSDFMKWMPYVMAAVATMGVGAAVAGAAAGAAGAAGGAGVAEGAAGVSALDAASAEAMAAYGGTGAAEASQAAGIASMGGAEGWAALPAWQQQAIIGAAKGGGQSLVTGQDPLKGAVLGAVGGGVSGGLGGGWLGSAGSTAAKMAASYAMNGMGGGSGGSGSGGGMMGASRSPMSRTSSSSLAQNTGAGMMGQGSAPSPSRPLSAPTLGNDGAFFASTYKPDKISTDFGPYAYAANKLRGG